MHVQHNQKSFRSFHHCAISSSQYIMHANSLMVAKTKQDLESSCLGTNASCIASDAVCNLQP